MSNSRPFLSIVIPAYNEAENFKQGVLDEVHEYISRLPYESEVIVVDDGSEDKTADLVERWIKNKKHWRLIRNPHKGKARAVADGVLQAGGEFILFTDFDQATPIGEIEKLLPFMEKGYEVAIGSREVKGSRREHEPSYRHIMGRAWNILVQAVAIPGIRDTQCGFKLFERKAAHELFANLSVYADGEEKEAYTGAFDVELLFIAQKRGFQIAEVPVYWKHVETSRVHPIRDSIRMFADLLRIRIADLTGKYDK
ncbi:glycosyltransferase family 2 protein [Patescibacteria group bacterium]|nr:glycosyltransferase family 2 protein [Patescibacteria group bacterium]